MMISCSPGEYSVSGSALGSARSCMILYMTAVMVSPSKGRLKAISS